MRNINCKYNDIYRWCTNCDVERKWWHIRGKRCIEFFGKGPCKFKTSWPKPLPPPPPPSPKLPGKGLHLYCHACKSLIKIPGALLFSPPKGIIVEKYHFCRRCYTMIISNIETGELSFGDNRED